MVDAALVMGAVFVEIENVQLVDPAVASQHLAVVVAADAVVVPVGAGEHYEA